MRRSDFHFDLPSALIAQYPVEPRSASRLLCLQGELHTELEDGRRFTLEPGMSYQVADQAEAHRSTSPLGATLFVVD